MSAQTWAEVLFSSSANGPTLTAAARASCIATSMNNKFPSTFKWSIDKAIHIEASGSISSVITTPGTARFDVSIGGSIVFDGLAALLDTVAAHTTVGWRLEIDLVCNAIGTAATLKGSGIWTCEDILGVPATAPKGVLSAILPWNTAPGAAGGTFDSTQATPAFDMNFTQTVGTGSFTLNRLLAVSLN